MLTRTPTHTYTDARTNLHTLTRTHVRQPTTKTTTTRTNKRTHGSVTIDSHTRARMRKKAHLYTSNHCSPIEPAEPLAAVNNLREKYSLC